MSNNNNHQKKEVANRSPYAYALTNNLFRRRVVKSGKLYSRKRKSNSNGND